MPVPNLLDRELAKGGWVGGMFGQTRQSPQIQMGRRVLFLASGCNACEQDSVRDQGVNTALFSAACGHSKMGFLAGSVQVC